MAKLGINTGSGPNDGTGDNLRLGGSKINSNFDEIYAVDQSIYQRFLVQKIDLPSER